MRSHTALIIAIGIDHTPKKGFQTPGRVVHWQTITLGLFHTQFTVLFTLINCKEIMFSISLGLYFIRSIESGYIVTQIILSINIGFLMIIYYNHNDHLPTKGIRV